MCSEGKELVLAQVMCHGVRSVFYVVDLEADKACRTPVATLLNETGAGGLVRLGSVIYIVGGEDDSDDSDEDSHCRPHDEDSDEDSDDDSDGDHHFHAWASCLDLSKPHLISLLKEEDAHCDYDNPLKSKSGSGSTSMRWKGFPAMYYEREYPACASLGGKIYALGGGSAPTSCIGEVFMPESGEWKSVVSPPSDLPLECHCVSSPLIPDEKNERLLVHFNSVNALYAYYPANGKWDCLADNICRWFPATALVDGVLYSHVEGTTCGCLVAYDVMTKSWLKVVYSPHFPVEVWIAEFPNMFHLGNDMLCLANSTYIIKTGVKVQHTSLQFVKFRVKRTTPTEVLVTPVAINCFPFKKYFTAINFIAL